jgi:hypothetical protein
MKPRLISMKLFNRVGRLMGMSWPWLLLWEWRGILSKSIDSPLRLLVSSNWAAVAKMGNFWKRISSKSRVRGAIG